MSRKPQNFEDIRRMANEVADPMASRLGGANRDERPTLEQMLARRGGALPARLRRRAQALSRADRLACQPRVARQIPLAPLGRAHRALHAYLAPMGQVARMQSRVLLLAARIVLALLLVAALAVWLLVRRGSI
ncbi:MAG: hypothetical protein P3W94_003540 [Paracoccus sp. (in: a-proteobacteria)]|nr:hypothetical protein [Paracoccus sp. (in: a-proteobacteria)]